MKNFKLIAMLLGLILPLMLSAQVPILERKITLKMTQQPISRVLDAIAETAGFQFSYNPEVVGAKRLVTVMAENRTVKQVLDEIFKGSVSYQQMGKHLVLQKAVKPKSSAPQGQQVALVKYPYQISGYIRDGYVGDGIQSVSIYEKGGQSAALSGDFGYYQLKHTSKEKEIQIKFSKAGYRDTLVSVKYEGQGVIEMHINLYPLVPPIESLVEVPQENTDSLQGRDSSNRAIPLDSNRVATNDSANKASKLQWDPLNGKSVEETKVGKWFVGNYQKAMTKNVRDSFDRAWQFTFVPPLGTNGLLSGNMTNKWSFNALVGYNGGVTAAEFTGLVGIVKHQVKGAQLAGIGNVVGGKVNGFQAGGIFNTNMDLLEGVQAGGIVNFNRNGGHGVQMAGIVNSNAKAFNGVQLSGIINQNAGKAKVVQIAGIVNTAKDVQGVQIAGIVNVARKVNGLQLGLINIADTVNGFMFGIINFVKNGLHQAEFGWNEAGFGGFSYRSGKRGFYSIVSIMGQYPMDVRNDLFAYGYGVGSDVKLFKPLYWTNEVKAYHLTPHFMSSYMHLWGRAQSGLELKLFKGFALTAGVSGNFQISDSWDPDYEVAIANLGREELFSGGGRYKWRIWSGWQFGIRLF